MGAPPWFLLCLAVVTEVLATLSLNAVSHGQSVYFPIMMCGYAASFYFLGRVLASGITIGIVYGVWSAGGVTFTAILGYLLFDDPLTLNMWLGFACICAGVYLAKSEPRAEVSA
ncbi:DMT family transporter [Corynebacterium freiburgense]|uniref:DMT family transporter n=1 Tax=Corynebacterium freiburgense TaxID=556548 RepID=UPI000400E627|nr:SMR family transporter [Corynebacterium freiburgense]WJZ01406.1 Spermidine export protein MdtJ [Corynebacterium freiburgense]